MSLMRVFGRGMLEVIAIEFLEDEDGFVIFMFSSKGLSYIHRMENYIHSYLELKGKFLFA
jgi:hypothetical protein